MEPTRRKFTRQPVRAPAGMRDTTGIDALLKREYRPPRQEAYRSPPQPMRGRDSGAPGLELPPSRLVKDFLQTVAMPETVWVMTLIKAPLWRRPGWRLGLLPG